MPENGSVVTEEQVPINPVEKDAYASFTDQSYLTYLVPSETNIDLDEAFKRLEQGKPILESIPQRETLFFDETVQVLLVLKTPWLDGKELQSSLQRLMISLSAHVVNSPGPGTANRDTTTASESIFAGTVSDISDPFVVVDEESEDSSPDDTTRYLYAVWKLSVPLTRPRLRLHRPSVIFSASAGVRPEQQSPEDGISSGSSARASGYLQSGVPSGLNLLESFARDPGLNGVRPRLSALRVSRVAPVTKHQDLLTRLRTLPQLQLPITALVHSRIRFARPGGGGASSAGSSVIALLELDFTPDLDCEALVDKVDLSTPAGTVTSLCDDEAAPALGLPLVCVSHDHVTLMYEIEPHRPGTASHDAGGNHIHISVSAVIQVAPGFCTPRIEMVWTSGLDLLVPSPLPLNPKFGSPTEPGIKRPHRPAQLLVAANNNSNNKNNKNNSQPAVTSLRPSSVTRPDSLPMVDTVDPSQQMETTPVPDLGITVSFKAPTSTIRPGDVFVWTVSVLNRSSSTTPHPPPPTTTTTTAVAQTSATATTATTTKPPRKLALVVIPSRRRQDHHRPPSSMRPPSTMTRRRDEEGGEEEEEIAPAVVDDNVLHALQRNASVMDGVSGGDGVVVCLSADARVGPLVPGTCHVVELRFLALRPGVVAVDAVRVVDLGSNEHVDIRDLPMTVVEP